MYLLAVIGPQRFNLIVYKTLFDVSQGSDGIFDTLFLVQHRATKLYISRIQSNLKCCDG